MKCYQLTYLISPELSEGEARPLIGKINSLIEKEGEILKELTPLTKKKLAFPIKKQTVAFLASVDFLLKPERLEDLKRELKAERNILRYLIFSKKISKIRQPERKFLKEEEVVVFKPPKEKKVELKELEEKLEEILDEYS